MYAEQRKAAYHGDKTDSRDPTVVVKMQPDAFISHVQVEAIGTMLDEVERGCLYNGMREKLGARNCLPFQGDCCIAY